VSGRVLVVDDEESIRLALADYLEHRGYRVDCAGTAGEARSLLSAGGYEVVIVDLRLSASEPSGGLRLLRRVREGSPRTRTVLLTAYGSPEAEAEARRLGIDALLAKSDGLREIASVVHGLSPSCA
jgi:two-component system response regulator PilR (NtrC family)